MRPTSVGAFANENRRRKESFGKAANGSLDIVLGTDGCSCMATASFSHHDQLIA